MLNTAAQFPPFMGERAVVLGCWQAVREGRRESHLHPKPVQMINHDNARLFCQWQYCEADAKD